MPLIANVLVSLVLGAVGAFGFYAYAPLDTFDTPQTFGSAITVINGSDTLSSSRTVINNNFAALNAGKFELSDWYATTSAAQLTKLENLNWVGTITTGVWSGTAVGPTKGGTGQSTYTTGDILYASGANTLSKLGIGSNGKFLSITAGVPAWESVSVDQAANYNWTGIHTFATTTTATSTVTGSFTVNDNTTLSGVARVASTSVWTADGTWTKPSGAKKVFVQAWGGGGSGGGHTSEGGGGGGGEYREMWFEASALSSSATVDVGAGGAAQAGSGDGNAGAASTFDGITVANGGAGGASAAGSSDIAGGSGGALFGNVNSFWGSGGTAAVGQSGVYSGGGGGVNTSFNGFNGGSSYYGGGGGGGGGTSGTQGSGGSSTRGGAGGAGANGSTATSGSAPGGGGGGNSGSGSSGAGGSGRIIITTFF